jgi:hypothetical protein
VKASKEEIGCPAVACIVHHSDHLTLNPSPEGEGLSSIPVGMVAPAVNKIHHCSNAKTTPRALLIFIGQAKSAKDYLKYRPTTRVISIN